MFPQGWSANFALFCTQQAFLNFLGFALGVKQLVDVLVVVSNRVGCIPTSKTGISWWDTYLVSASPHAYTRAGLLWWLCKCPVQWQRWPVWLDDHEPLLMVRSTWRLVWAQSEEADLLHQRSVWSQLLGLQQDQTSSWACMERSFSAKNRYCWACLWYWKHHCRPWWGGWLSAKDIIWNCVGRFDCRSWGIRMFASWWLQWPALEWELETKWQFMLWPQPNGLVCTVLCSNSLWRVQAQQPQVKNEVESDDATNARSSMSLSKPLMQIYNKAVPPGYSWQSLFAWLVQFYLNLIIHIQIW